MSNIHERFRAFKHQCVLQLVIKHGPFYEDVARVRSIYRIAPVVSVPCESGHACLLVPPGTSHEYLKYRDEILLLHNRRIPPSLYVGEKDISALWWNPFLRSCVLCDPPDDRLLDYADASGPDLPEEITEPPSRNTAYRLPQNVVYYKEESNIRNGDNVYWLAVIDYLAARLGHDHATIFPLINEILTTHADELRDIRFYGERPDPWSGPVLASLVHRSTTKPEFDAAWPAIRHIQGWTTHSGRPPATDLTRVQCAIWHTKYALRRTEIARRIGTKVENDGRRLKPERAKVIEQYIDDGLSTLRLTTE